MKMRASEFLFRFFVVFGLVYSFFLWSDTSAVQSLVASWEFTIVSLLGVNAVLIGNVIALNEGNFIINASCIGIASTAMLFGLVSTTPKIGLKNKFLVVGTGLVALLSLNLYRILAVLVVGDVFGLPLAEVVHVSTWFLMAFAVAGTWYFLVMVFEKPVRFSDVLHY
ncbi:MAG: archaeosortase/exosortase family protein [Candidatus Diapherotrites archaeon]|nr:archaeosortase/exosortase family protein [Candidatus Diapherotrites archaeon]